MNVTYGQQMERCSRALMRASLSVSSNSAYRLKDLILARNEINRTIERLQRPRPRRSRKSIALLLAVSVAVLVAAPIGLRLLVDRPAAEAQR